VGYIIGLHPMLMYIALTGLMQTANNRPSQVVFISPFCPENWVVSEAGLWIEEMPTVFHPALRGSYGVRRIN